MKIHKVNPAITVESRKLLTQYFLLLIFINDMPLKLSWSEVHCLHCLYFIFNFLVILIISIENKCLSDAI